jgi:hypothetical protein
VDHGRCCYKVKVAVGVGMGHRALGRFVTPPRRVGRVGGILCAPIAASAAMRSRRVAAPASRRYKKAAFVEAARA